MEDMAALSGGLFGFIGILVTIVLIVLWTLLPFAVFGIKGKLDELISLQRETAEQLNRLNGSISPLTEVQADEQPLIHEPIAEPSVQVCHNCGQKNSGRMTNCTRCGAALRQEPHV
jgi:hypothetical protein